MDYSTRTSLPVALLALIAASACDDSVGVVPVTQGGGGGSDTPSGAGAAGAGAAHAGAAGAGAADPAECDPADPDLERADAQELFDYDHVPTFDFFLPEDAWEELRANAVDEQYVEAQACFEGRLIGTVGLRFKGYYGSLYNCFDEQGEMICPRLSMKVKFSEYDREQRFYGLKRLNFHAYRYDDSRIKERLAYDLYRALDIVAPRAAWAVLRVNGELQGLYGMVEQVDGRFTADRWPDNPDGNLYKEIWPGVGDEGWITSGLKTNEDVGDVSAFLTFSEAIAAADEEELRDTLGSYTDLDYLARYVAVDDILPNYDGPFYYYWTDGVDVGNHNFYVYEEAPDRFTLIPWDLESTFWINPNHAPPHWTVTPEDCTLTYPYWEGLARAPGCDRVIQALNADLDAWRAAAQELLDEHFTVEAMTDAIDRHADFIREEVLADPTPLTYGTFDSAVSGMRNSIPALRTRFEQLLADAP
jgi:spore coat protein H